MSNRLANMKNNYERSELELADAKRRVHELELSIEATARRLTIARAAEVFGTVAGGVLPNPMGPAVGFGATAQSAFELARLEAELSTGKRDLEMARSGLEAVKQDRRNYEANIPIYEQEMRSQGCHVP